MPDISMCSGENCSNKNKCYRFRAVPSQFRQSYFMVPPLKKDKSCDNFWGLENAPTRLSPIK